jgi:hypothetical protein
MRASFDFDARFESARRCMSSARSCQDAIRTVRLHSTHFVRAGGGQERIGTLSEAWHYVMYVPIAEYVRMDFEMLPMKPVRFFFCRFLFHVAILVLRFCLWVGNEQLKERERMTLHMTLCF